jgi:hypothetical protein
VNKASFDAFSTDVSNSGALPITTDEAVAGYATYSMLGTPRSRV